VALVLSNLKIDAISLGVRGLLLLAESIIIHELLKK
jgi:hypothetical protein